MKHIFYVQYIFPVKFCGFRDKLKKDKRFVHFLTRIFNKKGVTHKQRELDDRISLLSFFQCKELRLK
jgi:hypothetical protein